jgi:hypothetical protein
MEDRLGPMQLEIGSLWTVQIRLALTLMQVVWGKLYN